jgi:hypothetical protein
MEHFFLNCHSVLTLLLRALTGGEKWVYEFTPKSKRNFMTWKHPHSPITKKRKKKSKVSHLQKKKTTATMFWDHESLLLRELLPPKTTINRDKHWTLSKNCRKPLNERDQDDLSLE